MGLRDRRGRPDRVRRAATPVTVTSEHTLTCRAGPDTVWALLSDPCSALHRRAGTVHGAWLNGAPSGTGGIQVFVHRDPVTGAESVQAVRVDEYDPGRRLSWQCLDGAPDGVRSGGEVTIRGWEDGSTTATLVAWSELPAGTGYGAVSLHQVELSARTATLVRHYREHLDLL